MIFHISRPEGAGKYDFLLNSPTENRQRKREGEGGWGREGGDRKEGMGGKKRGKRKEMSKWKKMGKWGDGWRSERVRD